MCACPHLLDTLSRQSPRATEKNSSEELYSILNNNPNPVFVVLYTSEFIGRITMVILLARCLTNIALIIFVSVIFITIACKLLPGCE